jgi:hypothetical protein
MGGVEHFRVGAQTMQNLAEKPLARIGAPALGQVLRADLPGQRGDLRRFRRAGVIFPKPGQRRRILGKPFVISQRLAARVHRQRRAPGRVHPDADDLFRLESAHGFLGRSQGLLDGDLRALDIIARMLPRQVGVASQNHALRAVFVAPNRRRLLLPVGGVDDQRPHRVGSVIQSNDIFCAHN